MKRYEFEANRHFGLLDAQLEGKKWILGDTYTIVDMALWGWARLLPFVLGGEEAAAKYPNVKRLVDELTQRPAAQKALAIKDRHAFKTEMDEAAFKAMFPGGYRQAV